MPRLTSFNPDVFDTPEPGNQWQITKSRTTGLFGSRFMIASRGEVKMILCEGESARILERVNNSYLVKLPIEGKEHEFTIFPRSGQPVSIYRVYPEFIALKTNSTRIEVAWKLGGKAIYRPAWKDSDEAKGIVGFIDPLDFPDLATEEAIVWLTGTLAVVGLPYMQAD